MAATSISRIGAETQNSSPQYPFLTRTIALIFSRKGVQATCILTAIAVNPLAIADYISIASVLNIMRVAIAIFTATTINMGDLRRVSAWISNTLILSAINVPLCWVLDPTNSPAAAGTVMAVFAATQYVASVRETHPSHPMERTIENVVWFVHHHLPAFLT